MSDPYARPGGDPHHGSWSSPGGYPWQPGSGQEPYEGQYPPNGYYGNGGNQPPPRTHGMTTFAMVTGIVAAVISLVPFLGFISFILGPLAMVLGIVGIAKRFRSRGFSVTALVTGTFGLLVSILYAVLLSTILSFYDNTQSFEFEAEGTGEYELSLTTTSALPVTTNESGRYGSTVDASTLFGGIVVTNLDGNRGTISCRIYDSTGNLLVENTDVGIDAVAQCMLSDVLVRKVEDLDFPEEISARGLG
ncbi:hypothetical protein Q2T94_06730 [Paeniglutamicibacter sulfureus]|uniref:hypothetical protein n=1 Tax=Paeniglutamicibacter sulfureus TaxID=43666 RepID=UPI002665BF67|nr:hypothetical protein [Paeniglutamicibacter sulfureus]MDO2933992.1 hypothetical protein [Paeniglutamicibacter sulfureus]